MFITVFTTVRHSSLSRGKWTHFMLYHSIFFRGVLFFVLSSHLYLDQPSCSFLPPGFINNISHIFSSPHNKPRAVHPNLLDLNVRMIVGVHWHSRMFSSCTYLQSPTPSFFTPSLFCTNIFLSSLLSKSLYIHSSLTARDQVSHPYKKM